MINPNSLEIGKGWRQLVVSLDATLRSIDPDYQVLQIKEKFGGLRFYFRHSESLSQKLIDNMNKCVDVVEWMSENTCEWCGAPGEKRTVNHWVKTVCESCNR